MKRLWRKLVGKKKRQRQRAHDVRDEGAAAAAAGGTVISAGTIPVHDVGQHGWCTDTPPHADEEAQAAHTTVQTDVARDNDAAAVQEGSFRPVEDRAAGDDAAAPLLQTGFVSADDASGAQTRTWRALPQQGEQQAWPGVRAQQHDWQATPGAGARRVVAGACICGAAAHVATSAVAA